MFREFGRSAGKMGRYIEKGVCHSIMGRTCRTK